MRTTVALATLLSAVVSASAAEKLHFSKTLTDIERRCLTEILRNGHWRVTPQFHRAMIAAAVAATADLKGHGQKQYIFVITDFASCGTAGCALLIAEADGDGICHEIYDDSGFEGAIRVLRQRDHGYRRLYTPCELRFDGHEYQQIHEECPTIDVQR